MKLIRYRENAEKKTDLVLRIKKSVKICVFAIANPFDLRQYFQQQNFLNELILLIRFKNFIIDIAIKKAELCISIFPL